MTLRSVEELVLDVGTSRKPVERSHEGSKVSKRNSLASSRPLDIAEGSQQQEAGAVDKMQSDKGMLKSSSSWQHCKGRSGMLLLRNSWQELSCGIGPNILLPTKLWRERWC